MSNIIALIQLVDCVRLFYNASLIKFSWISIILKLFDILSLVWFLYQMTKFNKLLLLPIKTNGRD